MGKVRLSNLEPDKIEYCTDERWAVIVINRPMHEHRNCYKKVTELIEVFNSPVEAQEWVRQNHRKGVSYFICEGFCMG